MTYDYIIAKIKEIKEVQGDYDRAHSLEDNLLWEFVEFVASHCSDCDELAEALLECQKLDFPRYTA